MIWLMKKENLQVYGTSKTWSMYPIWDFLHITLYSVTPVDVEDFVWGLKPILGLNFRRVNWFNTNKYCVFGFYFTRFLLGIFLSHLSNPMLSADFSFGLGTIAYMDAMCFYVCTQAGTVWQRNYFGSLSHCFIYGKLQPFAENSGETKKSQSDNGVY